MNTFILKQVVFVFYFLALSAKVFQSAAVPAAAGFRTTLRCVPARSSPPSASAAAHLRNAVDLSRCLEFKSHRKFF